MTRAQVRRLQEDLNRFTRKYVPFLTPLRIDGMVGAHTRGRIRTIKYYLGYRRPLNARINHTFRMRLRYPKRRRTPGGELNMELWRLALAAKRRIQGRRRHRRNDRKGRKRTGVGRYDGKSVANVAIPILQWCRENGWRGQVVSGWRDPGYSRQLCRQMCGRDSCPGRCAGLASNHVGSTVNRFAVDVSDYINFARIVARCPLRPRIFNALGARDPVHFSPSGN